MFPDAAEGFSASKLPEPGTCLRHCLSNSDTRGFHVPAKALESKNNAIVCPRDLSVTIMPGNKLNFEHPYSIKIYS